MSKKKYSLFHKLKNKYRLIIYDDNNFQEVWSYRLNRLNVVTLLGVTIASVCFIVFALIAWTPLKAYVIPDFPKEEERRLVLENKRKTDSIENVLRMYDQYMRDLKAVLNGDSIPTDLHASDTLNASKEDNYYVSKEDSILRKQVEESDPYNLSHNQDLKRIGVDMHLYPPVKGFVTSVYDKSIKHFGTDIVTAKDETVHAVLDGTVLMSDWTFDTGFVIQIMHKNNVVSVYKHNSRLFKKVGEKVKTGEAIATVGNTGDITTGPHLHFELWVDGTPVNPENYIVFK